MKIRYEYKQEAHAEWRKKREGIVGDAKIDEANTKSQFDAPCRTALYPIFLVKSTRRGAQEGRWYLAQVRKRWV